MVVRSGPVCMLLRWLSSLPLVTVGLLAAFQELCWPVSVVIVVRSACWSLDVFGVPLVFQWKFSVRAVGSTAPGAFGDRHTDAVWWLPA